MRVVDFNMTNQTQNCPHGFRTITSPRRLCGRQSGPGCASSTFPVHGVSYQKVCGRVTAYQEDTPDAFNPYYSNRAITIDGTYIDGVSITHGHHPRKHVWSFAAAKFMLTITYVHAQRQMQCSLELSLHLLVKITFVTQGVDLTIDTAKYSPTIHSGMVVGVDLPAPAAVSTPHHGSASNFPSPLLMILS